jgi:hypothetical protein
MDQSVELREIAQGLWEGRLQAVAPGLWRLQLDSPQAGWRLVGNWSPGQDAIALGPASAGARP